MGCGASSSQTKVLDEPADHNETQISKSHESLRSYSINGTKTLSDSPINLTANNNGVYSLWAEANGLKGFKGIQKDMFINYLDRDSHCWKEAIVVEVNEENLSVTLRLNNRHKTKDKIIFLNIDSKDLCPIQVDLSHTQKVLGQELNPEQLKLSQMYLRNGIIENNSNKNDSKVDNNIRISEASSTYSPKQNNKYHKGQQVLALDEFIRKDSNDVALKWRPAQIIDISEDEKLVRIHYINWDSKWDETIDLVVDSHRIRLPSNISNGIENNAVIMKKPKPHRRNSVEQNAHKDLNDIVRNSLSNLQLLQNTPGLSSENSVQDLDIRQNSNMRQNSSLKQSSSLGPNPNIRQNSNLGQNQQQLSDSKKQIDENRNIEELFDKRMKEYGMTIVDVEGDGNCLFRAVSHQLYGNEDHHFELRQLCVDHMRKHTKRFEIYCTSKFEDHLKRMSLASVWADDLEIRALEEIIDRLFYIYSPDLLDNSNEPMPMNINYSELPLLKDITPIKLSYHGRSHYNSVVDNRLNLPLSPRNTSIILDSRIKIFEEEENAAKLKKSNNSNNNNNNSNKNNRLYNSNKRKKDNTRKLFSS